MGTAKYDHPGYVADTGDAGKYHVGIWCPHGYPAHIHIGRPADGGDLALLRLRIPDGVFQSLADDPETLCRRALGQALGAGLLRTVAVDGDYRRSVSNSTPSPGAAPCRRRGPDELPTAVVEKPWDSRCACVNSDVITGLGAGAQ